MNMNININIYYIVDYRASTQSAGKIVGALSNKADVSRCSLLFLINKSPSFSRSHIQADICNWFRYYMIVLPKFVLTLPKGISTQQVPVKQTTNERDFRPYKIR